ncbi:Cytochrome monooxygenase AKT7 like protein [Verticillium longisporum]|nr:Cytochrome monooxygenase AKT7 like protein [Verticillium longisporum]
MRAGLDFVPTGSYITNSKKSRMANLSHLWFWLGLIAAAAALYTIILIVYRIFFHPLAKYPGPLIAKVTDAYQLYHAWKGDRHLEFWRMHEKYGKIVRFGPNSVSFNSNTALKEIYGFRSNVRKAEFYNAFVHPAPNTHNTRDKDVHARKRRVMAQSFSDNAIREMERYILANVRTFTSQIGAGADNLEKKGWSTPKNMTDWCNYLAMDILGDLAYGKAFHMLEAPDNRFALDLIAAATKRHLICGTMPIVDKLKLDKFLFPQIAAGRARYMVYSKGQLTERTKLGDDTDRRDFFYHLLKARDPETGQGFSTPELWSESNLLIIAGSDTTSTAMAATLFYITRSPAALQKATEEIRSKFSDVEEIHQGQTLNSCSYLRACVDEAMRLSPSVGGLLPREVLPGGLTIDGSFIPAGTVVGTPHYTIHHNENYYSSPFAYEPERWIVGATRASTGRATTEVDLTAAQSAFCPFSVGPRGCIGKGLAYVEMMVTLARTLYLYDLRKAVGVVDPGEGSPDFEYGRHRVSEFQLSDTFTSVKDGCLVEYRRRD